MKSSCDDRPGKEVEVSDNDKDRNEQSVRMLEEEVAVLRRRLEDAPRRVRLLEEHEEASAAAYFGICLMMVPSSRRCLKP